jgi:hypothetical protein
MNLLQFGIATNERLYRASREILAEILQAPAEEVGSDHFGHLRIFLCMDSDNGLLGWYEVFSMHVGETDKLFEKKVVEIVSMDKATHLMRRHARSRYLTEISSWRGRDEESWNYGGAVVLQVYIPDFQTQNKILISFSGLTEWGDETFCLMVPKKMGWTGAGQQNAEVIKVSGNRLALRLLM